MMLFNLLCFVALLAQSCFAHMSIWHPSMYGWAMRSNAALFITPMLDLPLAQWWFRGLALYPTGGEIFELPAGKTVTIEIACHVAWTSYSDNTASTTVPGSALDACPNNSGAYHAGDPTTGSVAEKYVSGCALAIADVDDISKVTKDNLVIFSTNQDCVQQKLTTFDVPALMPPCSGKKCICAWFWTAMNGTGNYYMTGFDCAVTNTSPQAQLIGVPSTPNYTTGMDLCGDFPDQPIVKGPKKPFYLYNDDTDSPGITNRIPWLGNWCRAGYHAGWSFPINGAQTDIFTGKAANRPSISSRDLAKRIATNKSQSTSANKKLALTAKQSKPAKVKKHNKKPKHKKHVLHKKQYAAHKVKKHGKVLA